MTEAAALLRRLRRVEAAVRDAVRQRRATDPAPDDPFRGLYLSEAMVDAVLAADVEPFLTPIVDGGQSDRLGRLAEVARLSGMDVELLMVAMAPDVDSRFEQLYGYLNDDVTRRRAGVGLALRLVGQPVAAPTARARLAPGAPLLDLGLVRLEDIDRPLLSRAMRIPDRVVSHLLGADTPDPSLADLLDPVTDGCPSAAAARLAQLLTKADAGLTYLREGPGGGAACLAVAALGRAGRTAVAINAPRLATQPQPDEAATAAVREAVLCDGGLVVGPVDGVLPRSVWRRLAVAPVPVLAYGAGSWDPAWCDSTPPLVDVPALDRAGRAAIWRSVLNGHLAPGVDPDAVTAHLAPRDSVLRRAAEAAKTLATADGDLVREHHLCAGVRSQHPGGLERLARRIEPQIGWDDLVLPVAVLAQLKELSARARHRERVLREWRMRPGGGRGRGVTALFAGDSGTGKSMAVEVLAGSLDVDLYAVDLATVLDKYIGETEKNLERIFSAAAEVTAVLLFDEADALFGRRSAIRDAHDRYANIEIAYLLQRMESFDGLAILTTNLRANLDDAFIRRLDAIIDFPEPDEAARRALWQLCLGPAVPRSTDVDVTVLARRFVLTGGHIRAAAVSAGYLAADTGRPVSMADLVDAAEREYRKLGRLTTAEMSGGCPGSGVAEYVGLGG